MKTGKNLRPPLEVFRSSILHFLSDPTIQGDKSYQYFDDGLLVVENGKVKEVGPIQDLLQKYGNIISPENLIDYQGKLILPGFIDTHVHYPQMEMIGAYGEQLLEWLKKYTFPTESQYKDKVYAKKMAARFLQALLQNGTTTALIFATVHRESVEAIFEEAEKLNMRIISGKVLMDRNAPDYLLDTAQSGYLESKNLIEVWHDKRGRIQYAITPRFAPTSTPEQLQLAGKLLQEHPGVYLHTHVAENLDEVAWAKSLFPASASYLSIYKDHHLMGPKSVFAHGIHIDNDDFKLLHKNKSAIAFCPSSNLFLGSGLFNLQEAEKEGVLVGLGTDVGAGTSLSLLQTMGDAYKVMQMRRAFSQNSQQEKSISPFKAFYLATLGGAEALHLTEKLGNFLPGKEADFVVLGTKASAQLKWRMEKVKTLEEKLFAFQILGDDRAVEETYLMGKKILRKREF